MYLLPREYIWLTDAFRVHLEGYPGLAELGELPEATGKVFDAYWAAYQEIRDQAEADILAPLRDESLLSFVLQNDWTPLKLPGEFWQIESANTVLAQGEMLEFDMLKFDIPQEHRQDLAGLPIALRVEDWEAWKTGKSTVDSEPTMPRRRGTPGEPRQETIEGWKANYDAVKYWRDNLECTVRKAAKQAAKNKSRSWDAFERGYRHYMEYLARQNGKK